MASANALKHTCWNNVRPFLLCVPEDTEQYFVLSKILVRAQRKVCSDQWLIIFGTLKLISKIALVIIENGARWLVENFVLSRCNQRQVIIAGHYSNGGFQFSKWRPDSLMFRSCKLSGFILFSRIITSAILLKQLVTSGSVNIAIVISTLSRWLYADIHVALGD